MTQTQSGHPPAHAPLLLGELAKDKNLSAEFLKSCGLFDDPAKGGVAIPYRDLEGNVIVHKLRTALQAKEGSRWPRGKPLSPYGLDRLNLAHFLKYCFVVEGESDCWALWRHGLPALGLPGSGATRCLAIGALAGISKLYLHREPDEAGSRFVDALVGHLAREGYAGQVFEVRMPVGFKDPADLQAANPQNFLAAMETVRNASLPRSLALEAARGVRSAGRETNVAAPSPDAAAPSPRVAAAPPFEGLTRAASADSVDVRPVRWLWPGRIPIGKLTVLDGDPGLGKSSLTLDLAARLTRGQAMPGCTDEECYGPGNVLLLSAEDGLSDTVRPRLEAAGARLSGVVVLEGIETPSGLRPFSLPSDLSRVEESVIEHEIDMVIIDPLMAFLGEHVNANNDQNVRRALLPLARLAEDRQVAVVVVRHLNKQAGRNALYRGGGSIGIIGAARSGLLVVKDPEAPTGRLLAVTKANLARPAPTLRFELIDAPPTSKVRWEGESSYEADTLLADHPTPSRAAPELTRTVSWLRALLSGGPCPAAEVLAKAQEGGYSERTLKRARQALGVVTTFEPGTEGTGGSWTVLLPEEPAA